MNEEVIKVNHLSKSFGKHVVLRDIDFSVSTGDVTCIIGASGSGKSTLLRCMNLLETPTTGEILYHGKNIADGHTDAAGYRAKVGMVFQSFNLFNNMTVLQNCMIGQTKVMKKEKEAAKTSALTYLEKVGMAPYINARPRQLSGGQKQRVAIAGVVAMHPKCIVLDEPTAMLDPVGRKEVIQAAWKLNKEEHVTIILITHYMEEVTSADQVIVMDQGKVLMQGTPKEVFSRVEELKEHRLDVPQVTMLAHELRKSGLNIPEGILTREELIEELVKLKTTADAEGGAICP